MKPPTPGGQKIALMQRIGSSGASGVGCGGDVGNATLVFDATAASNLAGCGYTFGGGTFRPTAGTNLVDSPAPAPVGPYSLDLTSLHGAAQNGTWQLFVSDHAESDTGYVANGWTLNITTAEAATTCASEGYAGTKLAWCQNICENGYGGATLESWLHRWTGKYRDLPYCAREAEAPALRR